MMTRLNSGRLTQVEREQFDAAEKAIAQLANSQLGETGMVTVEVDDDGNIAEH